MVGAREYRNRQEILMARRPYGLVDTLTYVFTPLPLAFVAKTEHSYGQLANNPVTVMGLAEPEDIVNWSGPNGSHLTV